MLSQCRNHGVTVFLTDRGVAMRGNPEALGKFRPMLKLHKASVVQYLTEHSTADLVREFMDVDGVSMEEARALAAISVQPRPATEWLAMIAELDALIGIYCASEVGMTDKAKTVIWWIRCAQSLASIPETLAWFRQAVARMTKVAPMAVLQPITKESTQ